MPDDVYLLHALKCFTHDIDWFMFFHQAQPHYLVLLQRHCPQAQIVVDFVDVHFIRLEIQTRRAAFSRQDKAPFLQKFIAQRNEAAN